MKKNVLSLLLSLALLLGFAACGETAAAVPAGASDSVAMRIFTDDCERAVEIPAEISSIVASGPLTQIVLLAIAPEMLAGLADEPGDVTRSYIPEELYSLPYFGQLYDSANLNVEALAAAGPQLVIDVGEAKKSTVEDMDNLQALTQIPSVHIEATPETMPQAFRRLGSLLGKEEKAEELALFCEEVYSRTVDIMAKVGDNKVRALYVLGENGLNVMAKGSYHAGIFDLLTDNLAVVENPTVKGLGNAVTMEQIALWNPDFVLFAPDSIFATAAEEPAWKEINAIRNRNYLEVPATPYNWMGTPPSVQRYLGLIWLTAELYPAYCDYDVEAEIMEYYELFYGCELTAEQYAVLTANAFGEK